jgi:hypothetical protein
VIDKDLNVNILLSSGEYMKRTKKEEETIEEDTSEDKEQDAKKERMKYFDYHEIFIHARTTTPILGGKTGSPDQCLEYDCEQINIFDRNTNGKIFFPAIWIRAMLRETSNMVKFSSIVATKWLKYTNFEVETNGTKPVKLEMKIQPKTKGVAVGRKTNFEMLKAPIDFMGTVYIPESVVKFATFKKWFTLVGICEGTGAFRKGYGLFEIVEMKDKGAVF